MKSYGLGQGMKTTLCPPERWLLMNALVGGLLLEGADQLLLTPQLASKAL